MGLRFPSMVSCISIFVILFLPLLQTASAICSNNAQCDDGDPNTFDICWKPFFQCYNLPKSGNESMPLVPTTLNSVIRKTNENPLSIEEKQLIISAASTIMAKVNPHLFLQLNLLNVDIVSELNSYSERLSSPALQNETNFEFHETMKQIFQKMDDLHTTYSAPVKSFSVLGFRVEEFYEERDVDEMGKPRPRFVVADVVPGMAPKNPKFGVGAEILSWNGEDIADVVKKLGKDGYGSNEAAQMSFAVAALTFRFSNFDRVPLAKTVKLQFQATDGTISTARAKWFFAEVAEGLEMASSRAARIRQMNAWETVHPDLLNLDLATVAHDSNFTSSSSVRCGDKKVTSIEIAQDFKQLIAAEIIETDTIGEIGRIVLPSFAAPVTSELLGELTRILSIMPETGLILDARGNLGGSAVYAAVLSILATGKQVDPDPSTLRATDLIFELVSNINNSTAPMLTEAVAPFLPALETALRVKEDFTGPIPGFPDNVFSTFAGIPRTYFGPVVSVVNGRTYSAGDYFALIQVDKNMSTLVGTSDNVGAGGAAPVRYSSWANFASDLPALPGGVDFSASFQRFYRSGPNSGVMLEYFGVEPQVRYYPTLRDAVEGDCDLFEFLGKTLGEELPMLSPSP